MQCGTWNEAPRSTCRAHLPMREMAFMPSPSFAPKGTRTDKGRDEHRPRGPDSQTATHTHGHTPCVPLGRCSVLEFWFVLPSKRDGTFSKIPKSASLTSPAPYPRSKAGALGPRVRDVARDVGDTGGADDRVCWRAQSYRSNFFKWRYTGPNPTAAAAVHGGWGGQRRAENDRGVGFCTCRDT
jgi:hypothetical protein